MISSSGRRSRRGSRWGTELDRFEGDMTVLPFVRDASSLLATGTRMNSTRSQGETQIFCQKTQHGLERSITPCRSKVERFKQCTYIEIKDFGALQYLVRDHLLTKISKMPGPRFPAVKYVALGEALIRVVGLENDQHNQTFVEVLVEMFSPVHLCVFYSRGATRHLASVKIDECAPKDYVGGSRERIVQVGRTERELMWQFRLAHGISHTVTFLASRWKLESLTLHGLAHQSFPIPKSPVLFKVF